MTTKATTDRVLIATVLMVKRLGTAAIQINQWFRILALCGGSIVCALGCASDVTEQSLIVGADLERLPGRRETYQVMIPTPHVDPPVDTRKRTNICWALSLDYAARVQGLAEPAVRTIALVDRAETEYGNDIAKGARVIESINAWGQRDGPLYSQRWCRTASGTFQHIRAFDDWSVYEWDLLDSVRAGKPVVLFLPPGHCLVVIGADYEIERHLLGVSRAVTRFHLANLGDGSRKGIVERSSRLITEFHSWNCVAVYLEVMNEKKGL